MTLVSGLANALIAVYVVGTLTATVVAQQRRRRSRPAVSRDRLLKHDGAELRLEPPSIPAWTERAGILLWVCLLPGLVLLLAGGSPAAWVGSDILLSLAATVAYSLVMQGMGQPLALDAEGFRYGRGRGQRQVRWIHVTDLQLAPAPERRPARAVRYRLNRALVDVGRSRHRYWDGSIRNAFGVETEDLPDAMRFRQAKAMAAAKPPIGRAR